MARDDGYDIRGFPEVELLFQAAGPVEQVAPELCGPARRWRSLTPYLPVRHRKRESLDEYLAADVAAELGYRPQFGTCRRRRSPAWTRSRDAGPVGEEFRRYRMTEDMSQSRPGLGLRLEFAEPVTGPLLLGQLSHFGYGIFVPDAESMPGHSPGLPRQEPEAVLARAAEANSGGIGVGGWPVVSLEWWVHQGSIYAAASLTRSSS